METNSRQVSLYLKKVPHMDEFDGSRFKEKKN